MGLGMKKLLLGSAALFLLSASVANATDLPMKAPSAPNAPMFNWTGFYVGANAGYGWGDAKWSNLVAAAGNIPGEFVRDSMHGGLAGVQWGYNRQVGQWVFGFASDLDWSGVKGKQICFGNPGDFHATCGARTDFLSTSTVRAGYAMGQVLPYVKGGWALAHDKFTAVDIGIGANPPSFPDYLPTKAYRSGRTIGAGIEYAVDMKWSAFIEYDYMDFGKNQEGFTPSTITIVTTPFSARISQTMSLVKFGMNVRY
jgi:outer membrane immunogenic protein